MSLMADELDDEERALIDKHRAERRKAEENDREVWIKQGDTEAAVPFSQAAKWLKEKFGIGLEEEPVQDAPADDKTKSQPKVEGSAAVTRFGRRVG